MTLLHMVEQYFGDLLVNLNDDQKDGVFKVRNADFNLEKALDAVVAMFEH